MIISRKSNDHSRLLSLLLQFHCLLNTAWPKPGVPAMAGASAFIGTTLFKSLEKELPKIQDIIDASNDKDIRLELKPFWQAYQRLFYAVEKQDRNTNSDQVDFAINLLYLASGIVYHRIAELSSNIPKIDARFIGVEDFNELLKLCQWPDHDRIAKSVCSSLIASMMACVQDLK